MKEGCGRDYCVCDFKVIYSKVGFQFFGEQKCLDLFWNPILSTCGVCLGRNIFCFSKVMSLLAKHSFWFKPRQSFLKRICNHHRSKYMLRHGRYRNSVSGRKSISVNNVSQSPDLWLFEHIILLEDSRPIYWGFCGAAPPQEKEKLHFERECKPHTKNNT